jgi:hypothetical protein
MARKICEPLEKVLHQLRTTQGTRKIEILAAKSGAMVLKRADNKKTDVSKILILPNQCLISLMIIKLPRNGLNQTQHSCRFGNNRLNMAQKGHCSVQKVPKFLNMFKFMTPSMR